VTAPAAGQTLIYEGDIKIPVDWKGSVAVWPDLDCINPRVAESDETNNMRGDSSN